MAYRTTPSYTFSLPGFTRAVKLLIIVTCSVYVLQGLAQSIPLFSGIQFGWLYLHSQDVRHGAFWQPFTYLFFHAGLLHLGFNMLGLWMFGGPVEEALGFRRFYTLYFLSGVGAGLVDVGMHWVLRPGLDSVTIGASGAVFGVLLAFALMFPNQPIFLLLPPITVKAKWLVLAFGIIEFLSSLGPAGMDQVSHFAHLGGMLFAFLYLRAKFPFAGVSQHYALWKRRRLQRRFEVYMSKRDRPRGDDDRWTN
ncbi:MAG: rhomboid family intramembrane serine protease [Terriglobales bacterium]